MKVNGYVYLKRFGHPHSTRGYVAEHRLVVEMFIGRYLNPKESVHHINSITWDNRIENLFLFPTHAEHKTFENKVRQHGFTRPIIRQINERFKNYERQKREIPQRAQSIGFI